MKGNITNMLLAVIAALLLLNQFDDGISRAHADEALVIGPVEPTVIGISVVGTVSGSTQPQHIFRLWSDGAIDLVRVTLISGCESEITCVGSVLDRCTGDLDYDREVAFPDLLTVLSAWGPCPE